jgi:rSAM/selenodomain-associated transferase 2/rSAM/selenodomain-associated transferase 1
VKQLSRETLIVFTRYPEPGSTKTRLIPALGPQGAADLQRRMTELTVARAARLARTRPLKLEVCYAGGSADRMRSWLGPALRYKRQAPGGLDCRMQAAFSEAFAAGSDAAVIVGSDIPGITPQLIGQAFRALAEVPVAIGPAADGGYYLMGLRREAGSKALPRLFAGVEWGSRSVLAVTLRNTWQAGLAVALLDQLQDVDRPEDLPVWRRLAGTSTGGDATGRISVIIPTLDEAEALPAAVESARSGDDIETIVVDGGSRDQTVPLAGGLGARVLQTRACRADQMNAGAAAASGSILLFLHADTRLPRDFDCRVRNTLRQPGVAAGAFELCIDAPGKSLRIMERAANRRARCLQMPYGDQALFLTTETFEAVGGFPVMPVMEDFEFVLRLRRRGRIAVADAAVVTAARRWKSLGAWRTWWVNQLVVAGYLLKVPPKRLARLYRRERFGGKPKG